MLDGHGFVGEFCILFQLFMMLIVGSTGTDINGALTSYEVVNTPSSSLIFFNLLHKVLGVPDVVVGEMAYHGSKNPCKFLYPSYVTAPPQYTKGLKWVSFFWILWRLPIELGGPAPVWYIFLYVMLPKPPSPLILFTRLIKFFFCFMWDI